MGRLKFTRVGLPFFAIVLGGAYGLHFFQQVRFDFRKIRQEDANLDLLRSDLTKSGIKIRDNVTVDSVYKEVAELDTDNWENIRGPRDTEDLTQYNIIKKQQQEAAKASHLSLLDNNPPEPDNASIRAERGSPTPSSVTVDNHPDRSIAIQDPFSTSSDAGIPEVPVPSSSALSISSQALSDPTPSVPIIVRDCGNEGVSTSSHPTDPQEPNEINIDYLAQLLDLGFDEFTASLALKRTNNIGVEQAVSWIIERSNESDFEDDSSSSETEGEDVDTMGAQASSSTNSGGTGVENAALEMMKALAKRGRTHKMVLVANMSLKMGVGKLAAQVGHATLGVYRQAMNCEAGQTAINSWTRHGQVKIVVRGQSTEQLMDLCKAAKDAGCFYYLVQDAGYTQIPAGSRTILGVFGTVEQVDSVTGGLKLL
ncbi:unnamed protein product [Caenorhabditis angaria]|uniref:peptidyl-tRNA hydrolase n=1 Tax=Caenorhabditis angaria TaxID=860376 RepID=A0A9P1IZI6_9PELO|nr:unnamed protein product [Caenorhabditis angaria]